jgi:hypothetical protein
VKPPETLAAYLFVGAAMLILSYCRMINNACAQRRSILAVGRPKII